MELPAMIVILYPEGVKVCKVRTVKYNTLTVSGGIDLMVVSTIAFTTLATKIVSTYNPGVGKGPTLNPFSA